MDEPQPNCGTCSLHRDSSQLLLRLLLLLLALWHRNYSSSESEKESSSKVPTREERKCKNEPQSTVATGLPQEGAGSRGGVKGDSAPPIGGAPGPQIGEPLNFYLLGLFGL